MLLRGFAVVAFAVFVLLIGVTLVGPWKYAWEDGVVSALVSYAFLGLVAGNLVFIFAWAVVVSAFKAPLGHDTKWNSTPSLPTMIAMSVTYATMGLIFGIHAEKAAFNFDGLCAFHEELELGLSDDADENIMNMSNICEDGLLSPR